MTNSVLSLAVDTDVGLPSLRGPVAVLHLSQLRLDTDGRPLPSQPHLPRSLHRQLGHHPLHRPGLG